MLRRENTSAKLFKDASTGIKVAMEFIFAKISASGFSDADIIQIKGDTKMIPMMIFPA